MNAQNLINKVTEDNKILKASVNVNHESKVNKFLRNNKSLSGIFVLILIMSMVFAVTTITENNVNTPTIDVTNITADRINGIYYVQAGNASDLNVTIEEAKTNGGGLVMVPEGVYTITNTINLTNDVIVRGYGHNTIIQLGEGSDFNIFDMCGGFTRVEDLYVDTTVVGYNSSAFAFKDECDEKSNWLYLNNVFIKGNTNTNNLDKGISVIANGGNGITWLLIQNVRISGYRYGLYLEASGVGSHVKGNTFENINFIGSKYGVWENSSISAGAIAGNTFDIRMNGNANSEYAVHADGRNEIFRSVIFDSYDFAQAIAYNLTANADDTIIIDPLIDESNITSATTDYTYILGDMIKPQQIQFIFTGQQSIIYKNSNGDIRMSIDYDNSNTGLMFQDRNGNTEFYINEGGGIQVGNGTSQQNITLTSPDGTEFTCGVNNSGSFNCN